MATNDGTTDMATTGGMTGSPLDLTTPLNRIVEQHPRLLEVLSAFGLDTCCGGALPLETAARQHGIDPGELLGALEVSLRPGSRAEGPDEATGGACGCG